MGGHEVIFLSLFSALFGGFAVLTYFAYRVRSDVLSGAVYGLVGSAGFAIVSAYLFA